MFDADGKRTAVGKVVGRGTRDGGLPSAGPAPMASGRASSGLVPKAAMAGIPLPAAVSAARLIAGGARFGVLYAGNTHDPVLSMVFAFPAGFGGAFSPLFAARTGLLRRERQRVELRPGPRRETGRCGHRDRGASGRSRWAWRVRSVCSAMIFSAASAS